MHPSAERKPATTVEALKVPPHSIEAEQAVLGGLMLAPQAWERIADRINEDDFYRRDHRLIFRAIQTLSEKDQPCDAITLGEWFAAQNLGDQVGGMAYVIELAKEVLEQAPHYLDEDRPAFDDAYGRNVYQYYGLIYPW